MITGIDSLRIFSVVMTDRETNFTDLETKITDLKLIEGALLSLSLSISPCLPLLLSLSLAFALCSSLLSALFCVSKRPFRPRCQISCILLGFRLGVLGCQRYLWAFWGGRWVLDHSKLPDLGPLKSRQAFRDGISGFWISCLPGIFSHFSGLSKVEMVLLANGHFAGGTPAIFVIFVDFRGLEEQNPLFVWVKCTIRIFASFRQNHLFSAGGKTTVFQNDRFDKPEFRDGNSRLWTTQT